MGSRGFEHLRVYQLSEDVADAVWDFVIRWDSFAKDAVGKQLVRAADSIGANFSEGASRGTYKDNRHFARIGRDSLNETRHFLRRAFRRKLLTDDQIAQLKPLIAELGPRLNAYIKSIGRERPPSSPESNGESSDQ
jgi:four helix bundle protein